MSQVTASNLDTAKHAYELFAQGDIDTLVNDIFAPDVTWVEPESIPEGGTHLGAEAVLENVFGVLADTWGTDMQLVLDNWIDAGEQVIAEGRFQGTAPQTGTEYDVPFCHVMRFQDGRLKHFRNYTDTALSIQAISG